VSAWLLAWRARREARAASCPGCEQYRLPGQEIVTASNGQRVHLDCLPAYEDDLFGLRAW
jgi:hypothetical protein